VTAVRVLVHGKVQNVLFRDSCREEAQVAGIAGWVRNTSTGAVEAVFQGEPEPVRAMVEWCRSGPPHARVERVDVVEEAESPLSGFEIRD
jgi:acylphosphatase